MESEEVLESRAMSLVENHEALLRELVALRHKHRLSQGQVAERMGVSQPAVARFERYDSNPRLSTLRRYAMAVGARMCDVVIDDDVLGSPGEWRASAQTSTSVSMRASWPTQEASWRPSVSPKVDA